MADDSRGEGSSSLVVVGMLGYDSVDLSAGPATPRFGGAPWHFSCGAAAVGARPLLLSVAPRPSWDQALASLSAVGVDVSLVEAAPTAPTFVLKYRSNMSLDMDEFAIRNVAATPRIVQAHLLDVVSESAGPVLAHICPGDNAAVLEYCETAAGAGATVSLQLHMSQLKDDMRLLASALELASFIFLNAAELLVLTQSAGLAEAVVASGTMSHGRWFVSTPSSLAMVQSGVAEYMTTPRCPTVDPTGAGDALAGGLLGAHCRGVSIEQAVRLGMLCAAVNVTDYGSDNLLRLGTGTLAIETDGTIPMWSDAHTLISETRMAINEFGVERGWQRRHSAKALSEAMVVEVAELLNEFRWLTDAESDARGVDRRDAIENELADVVIFSLNLCNHLGIDLLASVQRKLAVNAQKYPAVVARLFEKPFPPV